jgi:hypothetical protein
MLIYTKGNLSFVMGCVTQQLAPNVFRAELVTLYFQSGAVGRFLSRIASVLPALAATGFRPINQLTAVYRMSDMYHVVTPRLDG